MNQAVTNSYADSRESLNLRSTLASLDRTLLQVPRDSAMSQATLIAQVVAVVAEPEAARADNVLTDAVLNRTGSLRLDAASARALARVLERSVGQERWRFFHPDGPGRAALHFFQRLSPADVNQLGHLMSQAASWPFTRTSDREALQRWSDLLTASASLGITQVWRWSPVRLAQIIKERRAELQPDPSRRLVVVLKGFTDTKGALGESGIQKGLMDSDKNRVLVYEVRSKKDVRAALERLHAAGQKMDVLVISAHAHSYGALIGDKSELFAEQDWLKLKYFRDGASIVWEGCQTGKGGKGADHVGTHTRSVLSKQGASGKIRIFSAGADISAGGTAASQSKVILGQQGQILDIIWKYRGEDVETVQSRRPDVPYSTG